MCKDELTRLVAERLGLNHKKGIRVFEVFVEIIKESLENEVEVSVRNFGSFQVRKYGERKCRNPKTGETFMSPPKKKIHFKAGKNLKKRINKLYGETEQ